MAQQLGLQVEIRVKDVEELYPDNLPVNDVAAYLAKLKAQAILPDLKVGEILLTSDTTVLLDGQILGKPQDRNEAIEMLSKLSNKSHEVLTGVFLCDIEQEYNFTVSTLVHFDELTNTEIEYYVDTYEPYDKAGAYGIQEWIGYIAIKSISGCYYNVMGLPVHDI